MQPTKTRSSPLVRRAILAALLSIALSQTARAQLGSAIPGFYNLPNSDFTWIWGAANELELRGSADFHARGRESSFDCELTANISPASSYTQSEIRQMENQIGTSLAFIQEAAYLMQDWEYNRVIMWGKLACTKLEIDPDAEAEQHRLDRALERARRDRERRRARDED